MPTVTCDEQREGKAADFALADYRALDLLIAVPALVICTPLLALLAVLCQQRLGLRRRPFIVHKFRTMEVECDEAVHREYVNQLIAGVERSQAHAHGPDLYKLAADDRVTRVGRFLRKSSLDELPQIFDVLRGHMSLVGPRPVIPYEAELYPPEYELRFSVRPGITGLWQVSGRNERTYREMVALDIAWAREHSVGLYLRILARTPRVLLARRGVA
jgi:lipopolysaccharide/colanic/teichoic acid biosynthesis glycosyltransferase